MFSKSRPTVAVMQRNVTSYLLLTETLCKCAMLFMLNEVHRTNSLQVFALYYLWRRLDMTGLL